MDSHLMIRLGVAIGALRESLVPAAVGDTETAPRDIVEPALRELVQYVKSTPSASEDLGLSRSTEEVVSALSYWVKQLDDDDPSVDLDRRQAFHLLSDLEIYVPRYVRVDVTRQRRMLERTLNRNL
jgi:hypothetical protein